MGSIGANRIATTSNRESEIQWANKLQTALGEDYSVNYDTADSGFTEVIYRPTNEIVRRVPNTDMNGSINVPDYRRRRG